MTTTRRAPWRPTAAWKRVPEALEWTATFGPRHALVAQTRTPSGLLRWGAWLDDTLITSDEGSYLGAMRAAEEESIR